MNESAANESTVNESAMNGPATNEDEEAKPLRAVVFDLDGTLADTLETIARVANRGLKALSLPAHPIEDYRHFVGDGIVALCRRVLPPERRDQPDQLDALLTQVRSFYASHRSEGARLYPGIPELLDSLAARGARLGVLSNKPDDLTHGTLQDLGVHQRFASILGQRDDMPCKPDPSGARWTCERLAVQPGEVLYIGDTPTDMQTATAAGFTSVGVSWGFRAAHELREHGAHHLVERADQILKLYDARSSNARPSNDQRSGSTP